MTESGNSALSRIEDMEGVVWGDDVAQPWARMSHEPADRKGRTVWLTSSSAVQEAIRHADLFSSRPEGLDFGADDGIGLSPLQIDPPEHKRYRKMLDPLFAPKLMAGMEAALTEYANQCIDVFAIQFRPEP